jgi:hypothetical protein
MKVSLNKNGIFFLPKEGPSARGIAFLTEFEMFEYIKQNPKHFGDLEGNGIEVMEVSNDLSSVSDSGMVHVEYMLPDCVAGSCDCGDEPNPLPTDVHDTQTASYEVRRIDFAFEANEYGSGRFLNIWKN